MSDDKTVDVPTGKMEWQGKAPNLLVNQQGGLIKHTYTLVQEIEARGDQNCDHLNTAVLLMAAACAEAAIIRVRILKKNSGKYKGIYEDRPGFRMQGLEAKYTCLLGHASDDIK